MLYNRIDRCNLATLPDLSHEQEEELAQVLKQGQKTESTNNKVAVNEVNFVLFVTKT